MNKAYYFFQNYGVAVRLREESFSHRSVVEFLEKMWVDHLAWYSSESYKRAYLESLSLEQLARLSH